MSTYKTLSAAMVAVLALSGTAFAASQDDSQEYAHLAEAKINLSEAIVAAEKTFDGKAVNAALDQEQKQATYEVELMTVDGSKTVAVNGITGEVAATTDTHDGGEDEDTQ